ncbi:MAG TPA: NAD(P)/FAD-dependent oxidoreductase [Pyrinomonadaceae bacterium]|jgi:oxygen-dependent protoporphyrinogen oxidase|nr:NAD(P)/FAD-dependent oxidoreductase [Pyrinomonadaceae bacterium]
MNDELSTHTEPDVVVVGGGIAGLGAALRLQDLGLRPLVLESEPRVGGRMTTDRVEGFKIDRGVTLLGKRFKHMRRLARRVGLGPLTRPVGFALGLRDEGGACRSYRARRPDDILFDRRLSSAARLALPRFYFDLLLNSTSLIHGRSDRSLSLDTETAREYLSRLGRGGEELFARIFEPGLRAAVGGSLAPVSRAILLQTVWNTLGGGFWNLTDGVDRIPEEVAARVPVLTGARAWHVEHDAGGVRVEAEVGGRRQTFKARGAVLAVPGHLAPGLCPQLPAWAAETLGRTRFSKVASAHVALRRPPRAPFAGYGFAGPVEEGVGVLELEHLRAPGRCPDGKGMVSVYFTDTPGFRCLEAPDEELRRRAVELVERTFPESAGETMFVHLVRWETGIALFPKGRLTEVVGLRRRLAGWDAPLDLCGDYLDGLSSEGALRTGEQAADRLAARLARR